MSNDHGYTAANLLAQLPAVLAEDERMHALADAIVHALAVRLDDLRLEEIYTRVDELPETLLDILAADFSVDWRDADWSLERKRKNLKESWRIHRIRGTPKALLMAVHSAFGSGNIAEWFDYDGKPHHFKVTGISPNAVENYASFLALVEKLKRLSSVLDSVVIQYFADHHLYTGLSIRRSVILRISGETPTIPPAAFLMNERSEILLNELGEPLMA